MVKVQGPALRFVIEDFSNSYEDLLQKTGLPSLHIRRVRTIAIEVFKILNEMCPPVMSNLVQKRSSQMILDVPIICRYLQSKPAFLVRGHSNTRHLCY